MIILTSFFYDIKSSSSANLSFKLKGRELSVMAKYTVPVDTREKEKIVGGFLTMVQLFWIIGGIGFGMLLFIMFFSITKLMPVSIFVFIIGILTTMPFTFITKDGLPLFEFLKRKRKFLKKNHRLINKRVVK